MVGSNRDVMVLLVAWLLLLALVGVVWFQAGEPSLTTILRGFMLASVGVLLGVVFTYLVGSPLESRVVRHQKVEVPILIATVNKLLEQVGAVLSRLQRTIEAVNLDRLEQAGKSAVSLTQTVDELRLELDSVRQQVSEVKHMLQRADRDAVLAVLERDFSDEMSWVMSTQDKKLRVQVLGMVVATHLGLANHRGELKSLIKRVGHQGDVSNNGG